MSHTRWKKCTSIYQFTYTFAQISYWQMEQSRTKQNSILKRGLITFQATWLKFWEKSKATSMAALAQLLEFFKSSATYGQTSPLMICGSSPLAPELHLTGFCFVLITSRSLRPRLIWKIQRPWQSLSLELELGRPALKILPTFITCGVLGLTLPTSAYIL